MRCTKAAACLWSLCCLTSAESRFGRLGCDDLSGRKIFREEIFSGHLWHQCTAERRPHLCCFTEDILTPKCWRRFQHLSMRVLMNTARTLSLLLLDGGFLYCRFSCCRGSLSATHKFAVVLFCRTETYLTIFLEPSKSFPWNFPVIWVSSYLLNGVILSIWDQENPHDHHQLYSSEQQHM